MPAQRCGPYGAQHIAIQHAKVAGKLKNRRRGSNQTMMAIDVEAVCTACGAILDRQNVGAPQSNFDVERSTQPPSRSMAA
jgi:hypothetical protein